MCVGPNVGADVPVRRLRAIPDVAPPQFIQRSVAVDTPSAAQLSQVIVQVTAPSFLLGAVAAFISVLIARMNRIIDRSQALNAISDELGPT